MERFNTLGSTDMILGRNRDDNTYTLKKGKTCNEESFSYHAYTDAGVSIQVQLLLEF